MAWKEEITDEAVLNTIVQKSNKMSDILKDKLLLGQIKRKNMQETL